MTQRAARSEHVGRGSISALRANPYLSLLRAPGALAFSFAAFVGRMSMSMYGLGTVLLIAILTGSYGTAGTVAAAGSLGYAVVGPIAAQLTDHLGQDRVLLPQAAVFAAATATFIICAQIGAPFWLLLLTGGVAGAFMPSLGSMVRARWSARTGSDSRLLHTAFALESVNDELIYVIGPALVTVLATQLLPAAGLGAAALLCVTGTVLFALQRGTQPPVRAGSAVGEPAPQPAPGLRRPNRLRLPTLPAAALVTLSPAFFLLGAMFATIDLSTVAFATQLGHRPLAGFILAIYALSSAIGGFWYGSRHWRAPAGRRFTVTASLTAAGVATFWAMPGLTALAGAVLVSGLAIAPTLIAGYAILESQAPPSRRTESMAWLSSTVSVGVAAGSAVAGHILDTYGPRWGFGFAACCGVAAACVCLGGFGRISTDPLAPGAAGASG